MRPGTKFDRTVEAEDGPAGIANDRAATGNEKIEHEIDASSDGQASDSACQERPRDGRARYEPKLDFACRVSCRAEHGRRGSAPDGNDAPAAAGWKSSKFGVAGRIEQGPAFRASQFAPTTRGADGSAEPPSSSNVRLAVTATASSVRVRTSSSRGSAALVAAPSRCRRHRRR
jgi:hypothetical protein